ncbi:MAG TPA: hypothetical protein ENK49_08105 [Gammaproteobacteria bacterium]|nr:hypothetical protein [Gammaproteobacteria bacterium]
MIRQKVIHPLNVAAGALFTVSLANATAVGAAENPFSMTPLAGGYLVAAEGKCGAGKAKGREGKCGMARMDADGDGKVSKEEFMHGHEAMFEQIDRNHDGMIDADEREAHMKKKRGFMKDGKCGEGKCGGPR